MCSCDKIFSDNLEIYQIKKTENPAVCLPSPFLQFCFLVQPYPWLHKLPGIFSRAPGKKGKFLCISLQANCSASLRNPLFCEHVAGHWQHELGSRYEQENWLLGNQSILGNWLKDLYWKYLSWNGAGELKLHMHHIHTSYKALYFKGWFKKLQKAPSIAASFPAGFTHTS